MWSNIIGAGIGAAAGATAPRPSVFDYKKQGVDFLTGYHGERKGKFAPVLQTMLNQAQGKGLTLSGAERARMAAAEIARLRGQQSAMHQGINQRSIGRGHGAGSGMTEAAHLKADISGLNAERGMLGQIASADIGQRLARQQQAMGMATDLFSRDTDKENAAIGAQWQTAEARRMHGSPWQRGLMGAAQGWSSGGMMGGGGGQMFGTGQGQQDLGGGFSNWRGNSGMYFGNNVGQG